MKVFISWSGSLSGTMAVALREWLPFVVPSVRPYVSAEDIEKGARWSSEVASELNASDFGIFCITRENAAEPWINFEAGALSKTVETSRVCPLLIDLRPAELDRRSPLLQFQASTAERGEIWKLIESLNRAAGAPYDTPRLEMQFTMWWPKLESQIATVLATSRVSVAAPAPEKNHVEAMLEELLEHAREQQRRSAAPPVPPLNLQSYLTESFRLYADTPMALLAVKLSEIDAVCDEAERTADPARKDKIMESLELLAGAYLQAEAQKPIGLTLGSLKHPNVSYTVIKRAAKLLAEFRKEKEGSG